MLALKTGGFFVFLRGGGRRVISKKSLLKLTTGEGEEMGWIRRPSRPLWKRELCLNTLQKLTLGSTTPRRRQSRVGYPPGHENPGIRSDLRTYL